MSSPDLYPEVDTDDQPKPSRRERLWSWLRSPRRRGTWTVAICVVLALGVSEADRVRGDQQSRRTLNTALARQAETNRQGLLIIYNTALSQCGKGRISAQQRRDVALSLNAFSSIVGRQFADIVKRNRQALADPASSAGAKARARAAIAFYDATINALPKAFVNVVPPLCKFTVKNPTELAHGTLPPAKKKAPPTRTATTPSKD